MAEIIYTTKGNVKSYNGGTNAYTFYLELKLNSQSIDGNTSNITIDHYAHGNNGWNYSLYSQPRSYIKLYDNNSGDTVTKKETKVTAIPDGTKTLIGTWTGNVTHKADGTLSIKITTEYKANVTNTADRYYMPNPSTLNSTLVELPALHTPPEITSVTWYENNSTLINAGIDSGTIVPYLSNKSVDVGVTFFDDATGISYQVTDGAKTYTSTTSSVPLDFSQGVAYSNNIATLTMKVVDSMNGVGQSSYEVPVIPYSLPNLVATSSNVKRNGQTTGKVALNLKGTFHNSKIGTKSNSISLSFAYWKSGAAESTTYYTIPSTAYTVSGNTITISNWAMAKNGTVIEDVDKESAYQFKIKATDAFGKTSTIQLNCMSGEYLMAKFKDRVDFKKITVGGKIVCPHQVGEVVITSTNTNPSGTYGGTWELIDKEFTPADIGDVMQMNSTNTTQSEAYGKRAGHTISFNGNVVNKVAFNDTQRELGTLNLESMGVTRLSDIFRIVGFSDGGNSEIFLLLEKTGVLSTVDVGGNITSVAKGNTFFWSITITWSNIDQMLDEACSKFYWKRTA